MITRIAINKFRSFTTRSEFNCDPDARLTTIVGTAGSGKSTILIAIGVATGHLDKETLTDPGSYIELTLSNDEVFCVGKVSHDGEPASYAFTHNNLIIEEVEYHRILQSYIRIQYINLNIEDWKTKVTDPQALMRFVLSLSNSTTYTDLYDDYVSKTTRLHQLTHRTEKHLANVSKEKFRAQLLHAELKYLRCHKSLSQTLETLQIKVAVRSEARCLFRIKQLEDLQTNWTNRLESFRKALDDSKRDLQALSGTTRSYEYTLDLNQLMLTSASNKLISNFTRTQELKSKLSGEAFLTKTLVPLLLSVFKGTITYTERLSALLAANSVDLGQLRENYEEYQEAFKSLMSTANKITLKVRQDLDAAKAFCIADQTSLQSARKRLFDLEIELSSAKKLHDGRFFLDSLESDAWNSQELKILFPDIVAELSEMIEPDEDCDWCDLSTKEMRNIFETVSRFPDTLEDQDSDWIPRRILVVTDKKTAIEYTERFRDFPCTFIYLEEPDTTEDLKPLDSDKQSNQKELRENVTEAGNGTNAPADSLKKRRVLNAKRSKIKQTTTTKNQFENLKIRNHRSENEAGFSDGVASDDASDVSDAAEEIDELDEQESSSYSDFSDESDMEMDGDQNTVVGDETQAEELEPPYERCPKPELPQYVQSLYPEVCYVSELARIDDLNQERLVETALRNFLYVPSAEAALHLIDQKVFEEDTWMCTRKSEIFLATKKKEFKFGDHRSMFCGLASQVLGLKCEILNTENDVCASILLAKELEEFRDSLETFDEVAYKLHSEAVRFESHALKEIAKDIHTQPQLEGTIGTTDLFTKQMQLRFDELQLRLSADKMKILEDELICCESAISVDQQDLNDVFKTYQTNCLEWYDAKASERKTSHYLENLEGQISRQTMEIEVLSGILHEFQNRLRTSQETVCRIKGPPPLPEEYKDSHIYLTETMHDLHVLETLNALPSADCATSKANSICHTQDAMAFQESQMQKRLRSEISDLIENLVRCDMQLCLILRSLMETLEPHLDNCYRSLHPSDSIQPARATIQFVKENSCRQGLEMKVCPPAKPFIPIKSLSCVEVSRVVISLQLAVSMALGNNILLIDEVDKYLDHDGCELLRNLLQDIHNPSESTIAHIYMSTNQPAPFHSSYQYIDTNKVSECKVAVYSANQSVKQSIPDDDDDGDSGAGDRDTLPPSESNSIYSLLYRGLDEEPDI